MSVRHSPFTSWFIRARRGAIRITVRGGDGRVTGTEADNAGFDGEIVVYAPTDLSDDEDAILEAVGEYVARRRPVARALPDDATIGADATGREHVQELKDAGIFRVIGYPARGLDDFLAE